MQLTNVNETTFKNNFNKLCSDQINLLQCQSEFPDTLEPLLQKNETITLQKAMQLEQRVINYMCNKGVELILELRSEKSNQCLSESHPKCLKPFEVKYRHFSEFFTVANSNECADFRADGNDIKNCVVGGLELCSVELSQIYADLISIVLDLLSC